MHTEICDNVGQMGDKTATINIKVSPNMKKKLIEKARDKCLSLSTYCRMILSEILNGSKGE